MAEPTGYAHAANLTGGADLAVTLAGQLREANATIERLTAQLVQAEDYAREAGDREAEADQEYRRLADHVMTAVKMPDDDVAELIHGSDECAVLCTEITRLAEARDAAERVRAWAKRPPPEDWRVYAFHEAAYMQAQFDVEDLLAPPALDPPDGAA